MSERRLYVLGAGASKSHTDGKFPGIGEFFLRAKELGLLRISDEHSALNGYIKEHFGVSPAKSTKQINIEEILTYIEIERQRGMTAALVAIDERIKELIRTLLVKLSKESRTLNGGEYCKFAKDLNHGDSVVSFNWDNLLDVALQEQAANPRSYTAHRRFSNGIQYSNFLSTFSGNHDSILDLPVKNTRTLFKLGIRWGVLPQGSWVNRLVSLC
jgi:hypothetical protein